MDALRLFYASKLEGNRRPAGDRAERTSAAQHPSDGVDAAETLLQHLEQRAGRPLRSRPAIDAYFAEQATAADAARPSGRSLLRETLLVLFLVAAALQYYYIDVSLEIASLNRITVFVPVYEVPPRRGVES